MKKSFSLIIFIFCLVVVNFNKFKAQASNDEIVTTFLRPTIVNLYGLSQDNNLQKIAVKNLSKNSNPLKRFDQLKVEIPKLILDLPTLPPKPILPLKPPKPDSNARTKEIKKYNRQLALLKKDKIVYTQEMLKFNLALKKN